MASLLCLGGDIWKKLVQYLTLEKYVVFVRLNKTIRKVVNEVNLDYINRVESYSDFFKYASRYNQIVGLKLTTTIPFLYAQIDPSAFPKLQNLKLSFMNTYATGRQGLSGLTYPWQNFPSLRVLYMHSCNKLTKLNSEHTLPNLEEFTLSNFSQLTSIPLLASCPLIRKVSISECQFLNSVGTITTFLEEVNIDRCPELRSFPFRYVNNFHYKGNYFDRTSCPNFPFTRVIDFDDEGNYFNTISCIEIETINHLYVSSAIFLMDKLFPLQSLHLSGSKVENLPCISTLKDLSISRCDISEVPFLPALETLSLIYCSNITDITHLNKCKYLQSIEINDIKAITCPRLTTLVKFSVYQFTDSDLTLLQFNTNLTTLVLKDNKLTTLEGIGNLCQLRSLRISDGKITSLLGVEACTLLKKIILRSNRCLKDISALQSCTKLQKIYVSSCKVEDMSFLTYLKDLRKISIDQGNIILPSLTHCTKLENLTINWTGIVELPALSTSIRRLCLTGNSKLQNIEALRGCINLIYLSLEQCKNLFDISAIPRLDVLEVRLKNSGAETCQGIRSLDINLR
jgi:Leucine-rich repeat (LRR) protein